MAITLQIVDHPATEWTKSKVSNSEELFKKTCPKQYRRSKRLIQTSFSQRQFRESYVSSSANGFVWAAYHAYSEHHHLFIRPDDIWFTILTQLSFFINKNAEELREFFVAHKGQKDLDICLAYLDFELFSTEMTKLIAKKVVDPELRDWVLPAFSTTTHTDQVVGAILFMGAMQKYFSYQLTVECGLPSVTILGEIDDWKSILGRVDKIDLLGEEASLFAQMLRPIVKHIIQSFEEPESIQVVEFWNTIVHKHSLSSGTDYLTGWLTAFCFWDEEGQAKHLAADNLMFGDVRFPRVNVDAVPAGHASVTINVNDDGNQYMATMVAGSVGISATGRAESTTETDAQSDGGPEQPPAQSQVPLDTVQSLSGWWVCENDPQAAMETDSKDSSDEEIITIYGVNWGTEEIRARISNRREAPTKIEVSSS